MYSCVTCTCVFICMDLYVHEMYIFLYAQDLEIFLITGVILRPVGTLKPLPHVSLSIFKMARRCLEPF